MLLVLSQFVYDPSGAGQQFGTYVYVNLGTFNVYKHTCRRIWKSFSDTMLAGLYHCLYPGSRLLYPVPGLLVVTELFNIITLAYPLFKPELDAAKMDSGRANWAPYQFAALSNLGDLCTFFIPTVCVSCFNPIDV